MTQNVDIWEVAKVVHATWRDTMLSQMRDVPPERMKWETLSTLDKYLDRRIALAVCEALALAAGPVTRPTSMHDAHHIEPYRRYYCQRCCPMGVPQMRACPDCVAAGTRKCPVCQNTLTEA